MNTIFNYTGVNKNISFEFTYGVNKNILSIFKRTGFEIFVTQNIYVGKSEYV